jgi:hypothetical protein
MTHQ